MNGLVSMHVTRYQSLATKIRTTSNMHKIIPLLLHWELTRIPTDDRRVLILQHPVEFDQKLGLLALLHKRRSSSADYQARRCHTRRRRKSGRRAQILGRRAIRVIAAMMRGRRHHCMRVVMSMRVVMMRRRGQVQRRTDMRGRGRTQIRLRVKR